jgi:hypothetical protein
VYAIKDNKLYVNLFIQSETDLTLNGLPLHVSQQTAYPWDGQITIKLNPKKSKNFSLMIRIPGWAVNRPVLSDLYTYLPDQPTSSIILKVNDQLIPLQIGNDGYVALSRKWKKGDRISLSLPMPVRRVIAHPLVKDDSAKVALEHGPIVYCLEWPDNQGKVLNTVLNDSIAIRASFLPEKLNGIVQLEALAQATKQGDNNRIQVENKLIQAIPYYAWANRGSGEMAVWLPRTVGSSKPLPMPTICTHAKVTASTDNRSLSCVNDGYLPASSNDQRVPFYSLWPRNHATDWITYEFEKPQLISRSTVYWYDDGPWGGCRIPVSWKIQYMDETGQWKDVQPVAPYPIKKDELNLVSFQPIQTKQVRLVFQSTDRESVAIYEWEVN